MDRNFFEFWGQFFLNLAKGQKYLDDMNQWFRQGLENQEALATMFRKVYGLHRPSETSPDYADFWKRTEDAFRTSIQEFYSLWGVIPQEDYRAIVTKCNALEKTVAEQEQTIRHLKSILGERQDYAVSSTEELQKLLSKQQSEFQSLLNTLGLMFQENETPKKGKH